MSKPKKPTFRVVAAYDTETCNTPDHRAYPILYILNDFRDADLSEYQPDMPDESITFDRAPEPFLERLCNLMLAGIDSDYVPIVCAYNLMFDMQTLMSALSERFDMRVSAQSSTNVYTLDLFPKGADMEADEARPLLRFWDTFFLEQNGLKAMGETAGLPKATGDWDYSLIRTPDTPLSDIELYYAKRDTQVIPAYLRYLIHANEWLDPSELGVRVLTKTSIVRRMATETFGNIVVGKSRKGKDVTMLQRFEAQCKAELPANYATYALRKACFRGGWTFTAANHAMTTMTNVASLDVTSMHHTFINGAYVPFDFTNATPRNLRAYADYVMAMPLEDILASYHQPFNVAFHGIFRFDNIRPRKGTTFAKHGIWLAPRGKFAIDGENGEWVRSEADTEADTAIRLHGYHDEAYGATFAFGKLVKADVVLMFLNEIELWNMAQVYEWDSYEALGGESTLRFKRPPDYVTLQSNLLYQRKNDCKLMNKLYDGSPYDGDIPASIPDGIADLMRTGELDPDFLTAYYQSTVKGSFNAVYGTMAQDVYKPDYKVMDGEISVDAPITPDNFGDHQPKTCKVLYTYGMRIVARSRMHLAIAMILLDRAFGDKVVPTGGDTDSIKCSCDATITDAMLSDALRPIAEASTKAIARSCAYIRQTYPQFASTLDKVGSFDIEPCDGNETRWEHHMEFWNKARVSESHGHFHVTCAGLSRPIGAYHIEHVLEDLYKANPDFGKVVRAALGYNVIVAPEVSFSLQHKRPAITGRYDADVTDYTGISTHVDVPEAVALFGDTRALGDVDKQTNAENVAYMESHGIHVDTELREVSLDDKGNPQVTSGMFGDVMMKGTRQ